MNPTRPNPPIRWLPWTLGLVAILVTGAVLFLFNPTQYGLYPACPLHKLTGLSCPGCGSLRALHQLGHGHFAEALRLNPPLMIALPFLAWILLQRIALEIGFRSWPTLSWPRRRGWLVVAGVLLFSLLRNLPFEPFSRLAP